MASSEIKSGFSKVRNSILENRIKIFKYSGSASRFDFNCFLCYIALLLVLFAILFYDYSISSNSKNMLPLVILAVIFLIPNLLSFVSICVRRWRTVVRGE